jgi:divalent metal cation (Fe/Co/Zn/Cd) transporter
VAIAIFGLGGGLSAYEGITRMLHPTPLESATWSYWVLAIAVAFEGGSWCIAARRFWNAKGASIGIWRAIRASKDPTVITVLLEDSAALIGLALAFGGVYLSHRLQSPRVDGAASVAIGVVLAAVAMWLAVGSRGLLLGESASPEERRSIRHIAESDPAIERVGRLLTMHFGPRQVLLNLNVRFRRGLTLPQLESAIRRLERAIRDKHPDVYSIYVEAGSFAQDARTEVPVDSSTGMA